MQTNIFAKRSQVTIYKILDVGGDFDKNQQRAKNLFNRICGWDSLHIETPLFIGVLKLGSFIGENMV